MFSFTTDTLERYAARTSLRRESVGEDESRVSMEMNVRQLETMTLDRNGKEKKTSKIKKFFKKLSNKKDSKGEDMDHLAPATSRRDERLPSTDSEKSNNRLSSTYNGSARRRSDGTVSLYNINDATNCYLTQATPSTKRRLFAINLSFMKKGRRQQQRNNNNNTKDNDIITNRPSDTVRALCSPYATRRNRLTPTTPKPAPLISGGRRASESTVYRIQQQQRDTTTTYNSPPFILTRNNTATTSTNLQQQRRLQQHLSTTTPQHTHNKLRQQHSTPTMTTTPHRTLLTSNFQFTPSPSVTFPPRTFSRQDSGSTDEEADYINYPFSKSNVVAPQKPTRTASKGSKGTGLFCGESIPERV